MVKWGELYLEDDRQGIPGAPGSNRIGTNKRSIPLSHFFALQSGALRRLASRDFHPIQSADCEVVQILLSYCLLKFINDDTYGCFYSQEADGHEGLQCGPYQPALRPPHDSQGVIGDCVKKPSSINM